MGAVHFVAGVISNPWRDRLQRVRVLPHRISGLQQAPLQADLW